MKKLFGQLFGIMPQVSKVSLSANELVLALAKTQEVKQGKSKEANSGYMEQTRIDSINTFNELINLTPGIAKEKYNHDSTSIDLNRNKPLIEVHHANKSIETYGTPTIEDKDRRIIWFNITMERLKGSNPKVGEYFSYIAGQNITNSGGNMVQLLCMLQNQNFLPKVLNNKKSSKIIANENSINFYIKVPIGSIKDMNDVENNVIENKDASPIGSVSIHLQVDLDKNNEPRHHISYILDSNNEEFRKTIVQPLYNKVHEIRNKAKSSPESLDENLITSKPMK